MPLVGAALHPLLGAMIQRATRLGVGFSVVLGFANLLTLAVFSVYLQPDFSARFGIVDCFAILHGFLFYYGYLGASFQLGTSILRSFAPRVA